MALVAMPCMVISGNAPVELSEALNKLPERHGITCHWVVTNGLYVHAPAFP